MKMTEQIEIKVQNKTFVRVFSFDVPVLPRSDIKKVSDGNASGEVHINVTQAMKNMQTALANALRDIADDIDQITNALA